MDKEVDFSKFLNTISHRNLNICGPIHAGKTSFLKAILQCSEDCDHNSHDDYCRDRHFTIFLDFSDYSGKTLEEAICYFRKKMSDLYVLLYEKVKAELEYYKKLEWYLSVEESTCDEEVLRHSLVNVVRLVRYGKNYHDYYYRSLILIDEISRPILYASKYGYYNELMEFYNAFLDIDHYEMTAGIITTSYSPVNTKVFYGLKYIKDVLVNEIEPLKKICTMQGVELVESQESFRSGDTSFLEEPITLENCFEKMMIESDFDEVTDYDYGIELIESIKKAIASERIWIDVRKYEEKQAEKKKKEKEKREYAEPLAWGVDIPSQYAGIRKLDFSEDCAGQRMALNEKLKDLYEKYGQSANTELIYDDIQHIGKLCKNINEIKSLIAELKEYASARGHIKRCWTNVDDAHWGRINVEKEKCDCLGDLALVKLYVSVKDNKNILTVFNSIIRFLIDECKDIFHAKIAMRERDDHICLWVSKADFLKLEKHLSRFDELLNSPLEFVPYRGKIGITREFYSWSSYNYSLSELIASYLQTIDSKDDIDVMDMYSKYVIAWNGDLEENNSFAEKFKMSNAQELIILLESLKIILENTSVHDDNILLNCDANMWCKLGESRNWHEVSVRMKRVFKSTMSKGLFAT